MKWIFGVTFVLLNACVWVAIIGLMFYGLMWGQVNG